MQLENGKKYRISFSSGSSDLIYIILEHCGGDWYKTAAYRLPDKPESKKEGIERSKTNPTYINIAHACSLNILD